MNECKPLVASNICQAVPVPYPPEVDAGGTAEGGVSRRERRPRAAGSAAAASAEPGVAPAAASAASAALLSGAGVLVALVACVGSMRPGRRVIENNHSTDIGA